MKDYKAGSFLSEVLWLTLIEGIVHAARPNLSPDNIKTTIRTCGTLDILLTPDFPATASAVRVIASELTAGTTYPVMRARLNQFRTTIIAEMTASRMLLLSAGEHQRLLPAEVSDPAPASIEAPISTPKSTRVGGRPSGKHGEPIARLTKALLALPSEDLAAYTAASLAHDLIAEFNRLQLAPPSLDNAERDAAGILRALRN